MRKSHKKEKTCREKQHRKKCKRKLTCKNGTTVKMREAETETEREKPKEESEAQILYLRRLKTQKIFINILRLLLLAGFFVLWEIASEKEWINSFVFSSPLKIRDCLFALLEDGELLYHIRVTLMETFISFGLIMGIGVAGAVLLWLCTFVFRVLEPFLVMLNSLPKTALAPLLIVWLGNSMRTIIVAAVSVAVFGAVLSLYTGFIHMEEDQVKLIYTLGGNKWDVLTKIILPGNIPLILSTMKVNLGLSLVGVIIGEFLAANEGLGYLIIYGSQVFRLDMVILSILLLCVIAFVLYGGIQILEKRLSYDAQ